MTFISERGDRYTNSFTFLLVNYLCIFSFANWQFAEGTSIIEANDLESFINVGWIGGENSISYILPGDFRHNIHVLDHDVTGNGVWGVGSSNYRREAYLFSRFSDYCDINNVKVSIKYFANHASAFVFPCKDGPGDSEFCYLSSPSSIEWRTETFEIAHLEQITIDMMLMPDGYILFDSIIIEHDGNNCVTTTVEPSTRTEDTTDWDLETTTEDGTTVTHDPEGTAGTWFPVTLPETTLDTTTDGTTSSENGPSTTEEGEEIEDPTTTGTTTAVTTEASSTEVEWPTTSQPLEPCNDTCEYVGIDCHNYYSCINFQYKEFHTCRRDLGLAFNPRLKVCDLMENVEECRNCTCEYFPHHDCSKYYYCPDVCHLDQCELRECPSGLLWSIDVNGDGKGHQQCTLASNAKCASGTYAGNNGLLNHIQETFVPVHKK